MVPLALSLLLASSILRIFIWCPLFVRLCHPNAFYISGSTALREDACVYNIIGLSLQGIDSFKVKRFID